MQARKRGLYVRGIFWSDRPEEEFEAASPGADSQTGLANWAALEAELDRLEQAPLLSVAVVDVTGLTQIKEAFGRETADALVAELGRRGKGLAAEQGLFIARARPSGDEFVFLLPNVDTPEARACADSIALSLSELELGPPLRAAYQGVHSEAHTRRGPGAVPREWLKGDGPGVMG